MYGPGDSGAAPAPPGCVSFASLPVEIHVGSVALGGAELWKLGKAELGWLIGEL